MSWLEDQLRYVCFLHNKVSASRQTEIDYSLEVRPSLIKILAQHIYLVQTLVIHLALIR